MVEIRIDPDHVEADAESLRHHAIRIADAIANVDAQIKRMGPDAFSGHMADSLRERYARVQDTLMSFETLLKGFAQKLDEAAQGFRQADTQQ